MAAEHWKILLFVDQCAADPEDSTKLRNIRVEFVQANTTLVLQAMDKWIFRSLKHKYHRCLVCKLLQGITATKECFEVSLMSYLCLQHSGMLSVGKQLQTVTRKLDPVKHKNLIMKTMMIET